MRFRVLDIFYRDEGNHENDEIDGVLEGSEHSWDVFLMGQKEAQPVCYNFQIKR